MQVPGRRRPIPCLRCGYDITGLPRDGVCPECALPLRDTLEEATLLRSIEWSALCKIYLGIHMISWPPVLFVLLLPAAWVLVVLAALLGDASAGFLTGAACISGGVSAAVLAVGCVLLGQRPPARALHPSWARVTTAWVGPVVATLLVVSPFAGLLTKYLEPWATLLVRAVCQTLTIALFAAMLRLCQILEKRAQSPYGDSRTPGYTFAWTVVGALAFVWACWYWARPSLAMSLDDERGGWWGEGWALIAFILLGTVFWRVSDAVATEWNAARYNREEENFQE